MLKKVCNILIGIILIILIALAGLLFVPKIMGYDMFAVISGSMEPNISVGSIVYTKPVEFNELKVNDVIGYKLSEDTMVTHRIVSIDDENKTVTTKGDANEVEDANPVSEGNIVGKVNFNIPLLGYISLYAKTPLGIAVICGIVAILIILNFLPEILEKEESKNKN